MKHLQWDKIGQWAAIGLAFILPISTAATNFCMIMVLLAWIVGPNFAQKKHILLQHPLANPLLPLIFLTFVGSVYSMGSHQEIGRGIMDGLRLISIPLLIYFYQNKETAKMALWAFAAAMILTLVLAFLKVYGGLPVGMKYTTGAIFKSHIKTSYFMAIGAFFLALQIKGQGKWAKAGLIVIISLMIYYLLFMNVGRIGYITLVMCVLVLFWHSFKIKGILGGIALAILMVGVAYFSSNIFSARINLLAKDWTLYQQGGKIVESSLGSRLAFAKSSAELIAQHPIWGWGTGSFGQAYASNHAFDAVPTDNPHNEYLLKTVELGIIGLGLFLWLLAKQWQLCRELPQDARVFYGGVLITFMVGCLFNSWLKDFTEGYFFCIMTAVCLASLPLPAKVKLVKAVLH